MLGNYVVLIKFRDQSVVTIKLFSDNSDKYVTNTNMFKNVFLKELTKRYRSKRATAKTLEPLVAQG
jgi:hypothetical protein